MTSIEFECRVALQALVDYFLETGGRSEAAEQLLEAHHHVITKVLEAQLAREELARDLVQQAAEYNARREAR